MSELVLARGQMAMLFAFHIVFAVAGMGMPLLMIVAEGLHLRTGKPVYLDIAKRWARGSAILFAVGAVSGTVLSFELGLLWPGFMEFAGGAIGLPFALEGFAFFAEAIFLGIYLYGWDRIRPAAHLLSGVPVALGGVLSGILVVSANAWMNSPAGFTLAGGKAVGIEPIAAMANPAWRHEALHMTLAAYASSGFAVASIHAFRLLRDPRNLFHRRALAIALALGGAAAVLQPLSGDASARFVARDQPVKFAAMEMHFRTERRAPLRIGGIPDLDRQSARYAVEVPGALSLLAFRDPDAVVRGLADFPRQDWPDPLAVHLAFQLMVASGSALALVSLLAGWVAWRRRERLFDRTLLRAVTVCGPLGILAVEAGWSVTELGRQPWVIRGVMRTAEAATPVGGLALPFAFFSVVYLALGAATVLLLRKEIAGSPFHPVEDPPGPATSGGG